MSGIRPVTPGPIRVDIASLGTVYTATGRHDDAETAYNSAREIYQRYGLLEQAAGCATNLGNVYLETGRPRDALTAHTDALESFQQLGLHGGQAASCHMNIGNALHRIGQYEQAEKAYARALRTFRRLGLDRATAECTANLGAVYAETERHREAAAAYGIARAIFEDVGLARECAIADVQLARLADRAGDGQTAIKVGVPALLILDAIRFQLPQARHRLAWSKRIEGDYRFVFEVAAHHGDPELVAGLIDSAINLGIHHSTTVGLVTPASTPGHTLPWTDSPTEHMLGIVRAKAADDRESPFGTAAPTAASTGVRLVAGAALPLRPPPHLRISHPDGSQIALQDHITRAQELLDHAVTRSFRAGMTSDVKNSGHPARAPRASEATAGPSSPVPRVMVRSPEVVDIF